MIAIWALEWRLAWADRRRFVLSALIPLAIAAAVTTGVAAPRTAAAVYVVVFLAYSILGSALPLRWDGERGLVGRVVRGGIPAGRYLLSRASIGAAIDLAQLAPALLLVALAGRASSGAWAIALTALALSTWIASLWGVLAAAASRSMAETGLVSALAVLLLAHFSGAFVSAPDSLVAAIEAVAPFRALHEAVLDLTGGAGTRGLLAALSWAVVLPAIVWLLGDRLWASLERVTPGGLEGL